jgi:predicted RecB family endonuclease
LIEKEEHIKQFNNTVHKKITNEHKIIEEYKHNEQSAIEDLRTSETTRETYINELNNTKDESTITDLKSKIETITNTINTQKETVNNYTTVV